MNRSALNYWVTGRPCCCAAPPWSGWDLLMSLCLSANQEASEEVTSRIKIIGAGLAGCEAAWQCARRGVEVELYEMRPVKSTPAHQTDKFAELVCSNSLKSESENTAPWLLKEEMRRAGSLLIRIAQETSVPAGHALAVDRET